MRVIIKMIKNMVRGFIILRITPGMKANGKTMKNMDRGYFIGAMAVSIMKANLRKAHLMAAARLIGQMEQLGTVANGKITKNMAVGSTMIKMT
jgi:hypothetical protein